MLITSFGLAVSALLPLMNPVGKAMALLSVVGPCPPDAYETLAKKIATNTTVFLIVIELVGALILRFFGISVQIMQVSGGLVIAGMGWTMLNQTAAQDTSQPPSSDVHFSSLASKVFYPLTFPITAGPGSIVAVVTLSAHGSRREIVPDLLAHIGIALAISVLSVALYVFYRWAPAIASRVPAQAAHGISRVMAFVLLCIGVQILLNGAEPLLNAVPHPSAAFATRPDRST